MQTLRNFMTAKKFSPVEDFTKLKEIFTSLSDKQLQYVYDISENQLQMQ